MAPANQPLPRGMRLLDRSGLIPFVAPLAITAALPAWRGVAIAAFVAYGAVILSFLGGSRRGHWHATDAPPGRYVEAVLPSLLGFAALLSAHQSTPALLLLAAGFAVWLQIDLRDPPWSPSCRRMRLGISIVVLALHAEWRLVWNNAAPRMPRRQSAHSDTARTALPAGAAMAQRSRPAASRPWPLPRHRSQVPALEDAVARYAAGAAVDSACRTWPSPRTT